MQKQSIKEVPPGETKEVEKVVGGAEREDTGSGKVLQKWLQPDPAGTQKGKLHLRICSNPRQSESWAFRILHLLEGSKFPALQAVRIFRQSGCTVAREHAPNENYRSGCWKEKNSKV